jgi:hypothetical protein
MKIVPGTLIMSCRLQDLRQWPEDVQINWSSFARSHGVPGKNGGQIVKDFGKDDGMDTLTLDKRPTIPHPRRRKCKLPGGEVSSPSLPTVKFIQNERDEMIYNGTLSSGHSMYLTIAQLQVEVETQVITVYGRKVPLLEIRRQIHITRSTCVLSDAGIKQLISRYN